MKKKVMLIDDDKEFLEEIRDTLSLSGYDVFPVNDATKVASAVQKIKPDIILLDLKMPKKSGFEVANELRHSSEDANIPIIAMSAFLNEDLLPLMNICGIQKYLKKPMYPLDLIAQIEEVCARS